MPTPTLLGCAAEPVDIQLQEAVRHDAMNTLMGASAETLGTLALIEASAAPTYFSYSHSGFNVYAPEYEVCAPALMSIFAYAQRTYGAQNYGCHNNRYVAGTTTWSSHAFGRAYDMYIASRTSTERFMDFLIRNYVALGINTIHDYVTQRMWKPGVGWVSASIGSVGGKWIHVECTPASAFDGRSVEQKVTGFGPPGPPVPAPIIYDPWHDRWGLFPAGVKNNLKWLAGYAPPETVAWQPQVTYFNHVMVFKTHHAIRQPYAVFTDEKPGGSIWAMRDMHNFFNADLRNKAWSWEVLGDTLGQEGWHVTDGLATNFGR